MKDFALRHKRALILLSLLLVLALVAFSPVYQGTQRFVRILTETLTVSTSATINNPTLSGTVTMSGGLSGSAGGSFSPNISVNSGAGTATPGVMIRATGVAVPLEIRNSGGTPVASIGGDGAGNFLAASIDSTEIANVTRAVPIDLQAWIDCETNAGAALNYSSGADAFPDFINSSTDGLGYTVTFDDTSGTEDTAEICAAITVPPDYASGGAVMARVTKDAETGANSELLTCAGSINGAALAATGTITTTGTASASYTCSPTLSGLAAGDSLSLYLAITSGGTMDDTVNIHSLQFSYTATQ